MDGSHPTVWKELFFDIFSDGFPTVKDCEEIFEQCLECHCSVSAALSAMHVDEQPFIDQHTFDALGTFFSEGSEANIEMCRMRCVATCSSCSTCKPIWTFIGCCNYSVSPTCNACRRESSEMVHYMGVTFVIDVDLCTDVTLHQVLRLYNDQYVAARRMDVPLDGYIWGKSLARIISGDTPLSDESYAVLASSFMTNFNEYDCNRFVKNGGNGNTSIKYICAQRKRRVNNTTEGTESEPPRKKRLKETSTHYVCGGSVSFSFGRRTARIKLTHTYHHEVRTVISRGLSPNLKSRVNYLCATGLPPFQILAIVRAESDEVTRYSDVYNEWLNVISSRFKRDENPEKSALIYLDSSLHLTKIHTQVNPFGVSFATSIGEKVVSNWRVEEIFIDSTFKTNKSKLELFVIIASCMGAGFPIAYFLLEPGTGGGLKYRQESIDMFLKSVIAHYPSLKPSFFYTDKEQAQISSIITCFHITPSLCLWHLKRAVMKKLSDTRKKKLSVLNGKDEQQLLSLMDAHYFRSNVYCAATQDDLYETACSELKSFFPKSRRRRYTGICYPIGMTILIGNCGVDVTAKKLH